MEPSTKNYVIRFGAGMSVYTACLVGGLSIARLLPPHLAPLTILAVLPGIALVIRAVILHWAESDEFARTQIQSGMALAFAASAPILLALGLLELSLGIRIHFIWSFAIVMMTWALTAAQVAMRYRS
ncbi:MAG: hypothetical protein Q4C87_05100 [Actinomycetaceae bacterium]|nr:hypothetical protein [Actinomycetaceae bacterium]